MVGVSRSSVRAKMRSTNSQPFATLVLLSPYGTSPTWKNSHGALWLGLALEGLKPVLPQSLNVHINT